VAIRVKEDNPADEVWAMFIRRWGNEGFCSGNQHLIIDLPNNTYTFRLPWRPGATGVSVGSATTFLAASSGASGPNVQSAANQGVLVSFTLPPPEYVAGVCATCNRINGELHLNWQGGQGPAPIPSTSPAGPTRIHGGVIAGAISGATSRTATRTAQPTRGNLQAIGGTAKVSPEESVQAMLARAPSAQRAEYLANFTKKPVTPDAQIMKPSEVTQVQSLPVKRARAKHKQYQSVADPAKIQKNQRLKEAIQKVKPQ
jgi:hypothetical protein